jgi:hypothetical protein
MARKKAGPDLESVIKRELALLLEAPLEPREKISALALALKVVALDRGDQFGSELMGGLDDE